MEIRNCYFCPFYRACHHRLNTLLKIGAFSRYSLVNREQERRL
jgi:hypothetical protein